MGFARDPRAVMPQFGVYEPEALGFVVIPFWNASFTEARYCMARTVSRGEIRNKEWRPKGVPTPLYNEWMLTASLPVVYVTEGLIDAMALAKVTGKHVMALGGVANASRLASVLYHARPELRPRKVMVCMDEDAEGRVVRVLALGEGHERSEVPGEGSGCGGLRREHQAICAHGIGPPPPGVERGGQLHGQGVRGRICTPSC